MHHHRHEHKHRFYSPPSRPKQKGPYQLKVEEMSEVAYPNLRYLKEFMDNEPNWQPPNRGQPICTILEISADHKHLIQTPHNHPDFDRIIREHDPERIPSQALLILEDLSTDWIEYLGSLLNIDPHFFANHLRSSEYEHTNNKTNAQVLPSAKRCRNFTVLSYFKPILLESPCDLYKTEIRDFNVLRRMTLRHVKNRNSDTDEITIGLATRMVCYWHRIYDNGSWVGVLLTDPPLPNPLHLRSQVSKDEKESRLIKWRAYGGGYVDFRDWTTIRQILASNTNESQCMSRDIFYYWKDSMPITDDIKPWQRTMIILQKIALSDWMLTLAFLRRDYDALHLNQFADETIDPVKIDRMMTEIGSSRNLVSKCCSFARKNLINLGVHPTEELYFSRWTEKPQDPLKETNADWTFLYFELQNWKTDTDVLIDTQMTLLKTLDRKRAMADSERQGKESRDLTRLTYLGAIFGPVTFTAGILSMPSAYGPGGGKFWVFWVTWIPLTILIVSVWWTWHIFGNWWNDNKKFFTKSYYANLNTTHLE